MFEIAAQYEHVMTVALTLINDVTIPNRSLMTDIIDFSLKLRGWKVSGLKIAGLPYEKIVDAVLLHTLQAPFHNYT
jgi:hypothetical protein